MAATKKKTATKKTATKKKTVAAKPSTKAAAKPNAKAFEKSLDEAAKAIARGAHVEAMEAATFVIANANVLSPKDYGGHFHVDTARCLLAFVHREIGNDEVARAAMAGLVEPAFNTEQDAAAVQDELGRLVRKAKLAEADRPATARTILAHCLRHLIFWRETLAAGMHVNATSVERAPIGAAIATVRSALLAKLT